MARPIKIEHRVVVRAPKEEVWKFVADTDRINRRVGFGEIQVERLAPSPDTPARFRMTTVSMGVPLKYEEYPFEWEKGSKFRIYRTMIGGPVASTTSVFELREVPQGTEVLVSVEAVPRSIFFAPIAWFAVRDGFTQLERVMREVDRHFVEKTPHPFSQPASKPSSERLRRALAELEKTTGRTKASARLAQHLAEAPDSDCFSRARSATCSWWKRSGSRRSSSSSVGMVVVLSPWARSAARGPVGPAAPTRARSPALRPEFYDPYYRAGPG